LGDATLLGDTLVLVGAFALGFLAGIVFMPLRGLLLSFLRTPGRLLKTTQNVGQRMRGAFAGSLSSEARKASAPESALARAVSDILTLRIRRAEESFRRGSAAFDSGEYGFARRKLAEAMFWDHRIELRPMHVAAHLQLGWLDEQKGPLEEAKKHYQRAQELDVTSLPATLKLGMIHFRLGETGPAIFQLQRALELDPANLDTHYYLYAIYRRAGMRVEALEQLRILKAGENSQQLADLFALHGEDNFRTSRYAESADDYELALEFDPARLELYVHLGDLHYLQQRVNIAVETWCRGLWMGYSQALADRVLTASDRVGDTVAVMQLVRQCMVSHADDVRYAYLLSNLLQQVGAEQESLRLLEDVVRQEPDLLEATLQLGESYLRMGKLAEASIAYQRCVEELRAGEAIFRCQSCGYSSVELQPRCFQCGEWDSFQELSRREVEQPAHRGLLAQVGDTRHRLTMVWSRLVRLLPSGKEPEQSA